MELQDRTYSPPALVTIGDFSEVTLGTTNWGFDAQWTCAFIGCWS